MSKTTLLADKGDGSWPFVTGFQFEALASIPFFDIQFGEQQILNRSVAQQNNRRELRSRVCMP